MRRQYVDGPDQCCGHLLINSSFCGPQGYRTTLTEQQLKGAPKYTGSNWDWDDHARGRKVYDYYGATWREY